MAPIEITIPKDCRDCGFYIRVDDLGGKMCCFPGGCEDPGTYVLVPRQEWEDATSSFGYMQKKIAALQERIRVLSGSEPQPEAGVGATDGN